MYIEGSLYSFTDEFYRDTYKCLCACSCLSDEILNESVQSVVIKIFSVSIVLEPDPLAPRLVLALIQCMVLIHTLVAVSIMLCGMWNSAMFFAACHSTFTVSFPGTNISSIVMSMACFHALVTAFRTRIFETVLAMIQWLFKIFFFS